MDIRPPSSEVPTHPAAPARPGPGPAAQLTNFLELSPDAVVVVDADATIVAGNRPLAVLSGYDVVDLVGQPIEVLVPTRFRDRHVHHRNSFATSPTTRPMGAGRDLWLRTASRREVAVDIALRPLGNGQVAAVIRDVSTARAVEAQLRELERQLRGTVDALSAANDRLEAVTEFQREFLSTASHELRTPLTAVEGFASMLLDKWDRLSDDQKMESLRAIHRNTKRQLALVDDLSSAARVQAGRLKLRPDQVDVPAAVREAVASVPGADAFHLELHDAVAHADEVRVIQVVVNLLTNALRYGQAPYRVRIRVTQDDVVVQVVDHGPGVDPSFTGRMFQAFAQASDAMAASRRGQPKGTGLGLYISRSLARAMDGDLAHRTGGDGETIFELVLPRRRNGD